MKGLWFAFGLVGAVALAMWLELKQSEKTLEKREKPELAEVLLPVAPAKVRKIRWRNFERSEREIQVERTAEGWRMRAPYVGPADAARVDDLLQTVTQLRKAVRLEGVDPQKAGIEERYLAYVELEGDFGKTRLELGEPLPHREYGNAQRVRRVGFPAASAGGEVLLSFPPTLFNAINDFAEHFRERALAPCSAAEIVSVRLLPANESARLELRRDPALGWIALEPFQGQLEPELIERLVGRLATLAFLREASEAAALTEEHGFEPPRFLLEFGDGATRQTALELGVSERELPGMSTGAAAARFARLPGDFRVRTVSEEALESLLGPAEEPARGWADLRRREIGVPGSAPLARLSRRGALTRAADGSLRLEAGEEFSLTRSGASLEEASGGAVDLGGAARWIDALRALRAVGFARRGSGPSREGAMLSAAFEDGASITLLLAPPDEEGRLLVDFGDPWLLALLGAEDALRLFRPLAAWR